MEAAPATLSAWQPAGPGPLPTGAKPASPPHVPGGHEAASPADSASSSQHGLFGGAFPPEAPGGTPVGHVPGDGGAASAAAQQQQQLRNLQRLYGTLTQVHHHSSRTSLPDIAEEEPSPQQGPGGLPATGSMQGLATAGKPASKVMSEEDIFAMGGGLEIAGAGDSRAGGGSSLGVAGAPPLAYDLSLVGQMPAGQSQSRTLFVRNIDASITDEELHAVFEVRACAAEARACAHALGGRYCCSMRWAVPEQGAAQLPRLALFDPRPCRPHASPPRPTPQAFGEIHSIYTACKHRGFVVISYYDIRAATLANHTLAGQALKGQPLEVHFSLPKDEKESRQVGIGAGGGKRGPRAGGWLGAGVRTDWAVPHRQ